MFDVSTISVRTSTLFLTLFMVWMCEPPMAWAPEPTENDWLRRRVHELHQYELIVNMHTELLEKEPWSRILMETAPPPSSPR